MKLANRFDEADKIRVWNEHQFCSMCMSNKNCSLHHILGTSSSSILNSSMLCHSHHKEADGHNVSDTEYQSKLLQYTIKQVLGSGYELTPKDMEFYTMNKRLYDV